MKGDEFVIATPAEWAAVSSPARFQILETIRIVGACSLAELARAMGRRADGLYHHARVMASAGLLVRCEGGAAAGRDEAVYRLPAERVRFDVTRGRPATTLHVRKMVAGLCRMVARNTDRALAAELPLGEGAEKQIWARIETAWLDAASLAEVNRHLAAIDAIFDRSRAARAGRLFQCGLFLSPMVRRERPARAAGKKKPNDNNKRKAGKSWSPVEA